MTSLETTPKIDVKVFAEGADLPHARDLIPVFHRFIQEDRLDDLLIDVADYSHVPDGPGVLLVAHDAQYGYDQQDGTGLLYSRRRETHAANQHDGSLAGRLRSSLQQALRAAMALEQDADLGGKLSFDVGRLQIRVNDRLVAADDASREAVHQALAEVLDPAGVETEPAPSQPDRLALDVKLDRVTSAEALLAQLSA